MKLRIQAAELTEGKSLNKLSEIRHNYNKSDLRDQLEKVIGFNSKI